MKNAILILTVILFTMTANAGSFYHTCTSSGTEEGYYTEDFYVDSQATVYASLYGGVPDGGPAAEMNIVNNTTYEGYVDSSWGTTNIPSSISPGDWTATMYAYGDGGSCTLSIGW